MTTRINRAIELLAQNQAIYYDGAHSGHILTHAQGREDSSHRGPRAPTGNVAGHAGPAGRGV